MLISNFLEKTIVFPAEPLRKFRCYWNIYPLLQIFLSSKSIFTHMRNNEKRRDCFTHLLETFEQALDWKKVKSVIKRLTENRRDHFFFLYDRLWTMILFFYLWTETKYRRNLGDRKSRHFFQKWSLGVGDYEEGADGSEKRLYYLYFFYSWFFTTHIEYRTIGDVMYGDFEENEVVTRVYAKFRTCYHDRATDQIVTSNEALTNFLRGTTLSGPTFDTLLTQQTNVSFNRCDLGLMSFTLKYPHSV